MIGEKLKAIHCQLDNYHRSRVFTRIVYYYRDLS